MTTFRDLDLSESLIDAIEAKGFESPTPIQEAAIPMMLSDDTRDIIGQAQTGTGKTAAFGLPILEKLEPTKEKDNIQAIILTPTRELTLQVCDELNALSGKKRLKIIPVYGGASIVKQRQDLKRPVDVVVGTPGRVIDHLKSKNLNLSQVKFLVLDEADEMLTSGFVEEVETILERVNPDRKTLLFSATMPAPILKLAEKYMKDYQIIKTKNKTLEESLTKQYYYELREGDKLEALCRVIDVEPDFYGFIFCRTKRDVDQISEKMIHKGYNAEGMHGDLSQHQRERVLQKFRKKLINVMIVTDVAARGIDVSGLTHVINYGIPQDPESYIHRVGRTGRAGKTGTAITFITPSEFRKFKFIQKISKSEIEQAELPSADAIISAKRDRIKKRIKAVAEQELSDDFSNFADELLNDLDSDQALAAVIKIAFGKELSKNAYSDIRAVKGRKERRGRFDDRDDLDGSQRLFIAKGRADRLTPKELVRFIEKKSNVFGKRIQNVQILDKFSFFNVDGEDAKKIIKAFKTPGKRSLVDFAKK